MSPAVLQQRTLLLKLLAPGLVIVLCLKFFFAAKLDLYSDEVFYWLESTQPALAYSDLPFMTALLSGLGSAIAAANPLATRLPFILLGSLLPLLIYWLAHQVTGKQAALESALLSLCLPLAGFLGLLAVPDVPLIVFGLLALICFQRALQSNAWGLWLGVGIFVALGLCTHYRFVLYPASAVLYLIVYKGAREQWRNPRLWVAILIASTGLLPILWFNLGHDMSSLSFYLVDRHPWEFQSSGLLHLFKQAGVVSPPLYILLWYTAWQMWKSGSNGNQHAALLLCVAMTHLLVFLVLAPWTDASSTSLHWPISGYLPLLVFLPDSLRQLRGSLARRIGEQQALRIVLAIPVIGFCGTMVAFVGIGSQAFQLQVQSLTGTGTLSNKMAGWKEFAGHTTAVLEQHFASEAPVIVSDNYYTAAQVRYQGIAADSFTIDQDKAVRDGRFAQLTLWQRGESALGTRAGDKMLFITEDSTLNVPQKIEIMQRICGWIDSLQQIDQLSLFAGDKHFSYYRGNSITGSRAATASPCPYPPLAWIDFPQQEQILDGDLEVAGWAFNEDLGLARVYLWIDGERVAQVDYGIPRQDVVELQGVTTDPNRPNLGYQYRLDAGELAPGRHALRIELVDSAGFSTFYGNRVFFVR